MKKNKLKKLFICLFSFLFIASATVAGGVLLSGSSYSVPVSESSGEEIQDNENLTNDNNNATSNATEPTNDDSWANHYADSFAGGTGSETDPYQIETAEQLSLLAVNVNSGTNYSDIYFEQTADIDLSAYWWDAIGTYTSSSDYNEFAGHFNGGGHTVSGVFTQAGSSLTYSYQGLFGYVKGTSSTDLAEISNVGVIDSNIQGYHYVGGIAGYAYYTNITNCYNTGTVTGSFQYVGGVVGDNTSSSKVINSYNTGSVTGSSHYVGGVVGRNYSSSTVSNSYNTGSVSGNSGVGGVVGENNSSSTVENSYNTGEVTGTSYVGGVVGYNRSSTVSNSYNTGSVTSSGGNVGGVVGSNSSSTVSYCYYGGNCASSVGGINGADVDGQAEYLGTITTDAKTVSWYGSSSTVTWNSSYPWDFTDTWGITQYANDGYPFLRDIEIGKTIPINYDLMWTDSAVTTRDTDFEGSGTESDPYLISSAEELAGLAYLTNISSSTTYNNSNVYYLQTADIDVSAYWWDAIGTNASTSYYFQGHYDGDGHTVSGIYTQPGSSSTYSYQGLFGYVYGASSTNRAEISNVGVIDSNIQGYQYVGGIAGYAHYTNITNCYNTGSVTGSSQHIGGVVGYNTNSTVSNSYNTGDVTSSGYNVGGVVGGNDSSTVTNSYNTGDVTGSTAVANSNVGGVVGFNYQATVENSYNTGSVTSSSSYVGGVVGRNYSATVSNSYNTGGVSGTSYVGGVVGYNLSSSTVSNSYNTGDVTSTYSGSYADTGGVVGYNSSSTVSNSYNTGSVTASGQRVGGVVGYNYNGADVYNSFNTGSVTGTASAYTGAIVGYNYYNSATISNCYWGVNCTQTKAYGYNSDGTVANCYQFENDSDPKTYVFFQDSTKWDSDYPWDFETVWAFDGTNNGYPVLREMKTLKINIITSGIVTVSVDITTSGGGLSSDNILSTTTSENVITIDFVNSNSNMNVYFAFNEEPTSESALNSATYAWDLTSGTLNVYAYQRRVVTYHSNDANNESVSYEYIGRETVTTLSNPFEVEEGYHFVNWNANSAGTGLYYSENSDITFYVLYDLDLYAQISGDVYNVVLNHGNGTSTTYYLKYGTGLYQNNPGDNSASAPLENIAPITRDGYTFHGYYTGENGTGEQIIDENGNVVGSPTFTLSPTTIYAYWTVNVPAYYDETGGYWYIEYGKMPQTKLDSSVEADRIIINALDGDSVLDDTDGVTASSNVYYFAGIALTAKVYNDEEYCNFRGNWYKVEPIRWRIAADENQATGNYFSSTSGYMAVIESVVYVGEYSDTALSLNQGYLSVHGDESSSFSAVKYFLSNFNVDKSSYLVEFSANSQSYSSTGHVTESSNSTIFLSSKEEINSICGGYATDFSDLAIDYLNSPYGDGQYYFVRDLGSNLNSVCSYTSGGGEIYNKPISVLGMRLTIKISEYICL